MTLPQFPHFDRSTAPPSLVEYALPSALVPGDVLAELLSRRPVGAETGDRALAAARRAIAQGDTRTRETLWQAAAQLPGAAIEILPRLKSSQLSVKRCAAIAEMMVHPTIARRPESVASAALQVWSELFRPAVARVVAAAGVDVSALRMSLVLQSVPATRASGWAEIRGDRLRLNASWGLPQVFETALVHPDRFEIDLSSAAGRARAIADKCCRYEWGAGSIVRREMVEPEGLACSLSLEEIAAIVGLARAIASDGSDESSSGDSDSDGIRFDWSLGERIGERTGKPIGERSDGQARVLYLRQLAPLELVRSSAWFETVPAAAIETECVTTWRGTSASQGAAIAAAFVFGTERGGETPRPGRLWVCETVPLDRLADLRHAAGLVVEAASTTSHAILLARDLGLPIVVGATGVAREVRTGDRLEVNATLGQVRRIVPLAGTGKAQTELGQTADASGDTQTAMAASIAALESQHPPAAAHQTPLRASLSYLDRDWQLPPDCDGIGILRAEMLAFSEGLALDATDGRGDRLERWLDERLEFTIARCGPRPIFYRAIERLYPEAPLAERGMALYFDRPELLDLQLQALAQRHRQGRIRLLLPFVREPAELELCLERLERIGEDARKIEVWIMAEVPSILLSLDDYCQLGISGIAIGTNDLASLLLGLDRDDARQTRAASRWLLHRAIARLAETAKIHGLPCQLCDDDIVRDPTALRQLLEAGVTALSVSVDRLAQAARALAIAEKTSLLHPRH